MAAHTKDGDWGEWTRSQFARTTEEEIPTLEVPLRVAGEGSDYITLEFDGFDITQVPTNHSPFIIHPSADNVCR